MRGIDVVVPCPYCRTPSALWTSRDRDGQVWLSHNCPRCGQREVRESQMALGWARYEAVREHSDLEPLYSHDGRWFGKWTGEEFDLPPAPDGERGWFKSWEDRP